MSTMEETGESDGEIEVEVEPKTDEPTFGFPGMVCLEVSKLARKH